MTESETQSPTRTIEVVTDARQPLLAQVPTVHMHSATMAAQRLSDFTLVTVTERGAGRTCAAWLVGNAGDQWDTCPTPWHRTVRLSQSAWRALGRSAESGVDLVLGVSSARLPIRGALAEQMIADNEVGIHREDAARLAIGEWAILNYSGIPAVCRVRLLDSPADRGFVRLPLYGRLLLGVSSSATGLRPEIMVSPYPMSSLLVEGIPWKPTRTQRITAAFGTGADRVATALLRAPQAVLRTVEAAPDEDQALTVRLPADMFPLLGTVPGEQVYVEWGPGNRAIATALVLREADPDAQLRIGAATRATLGIPRLTVVTVRRRVVPLIVGRLNELIVPVAGLFAGMALKAPIALWVLVLAAVVILGLLLAPLRIRRPDLRRVR